ncbi:glycosyltransferase family A protein, partial [Staphylococcus warneri]|uniref:glycosyltransferase family A protein n=1 Tax=Staphylococcus warneri TaxID=1292 RepID=UPI0016434696
IKVIDEENEGGGRSGNVGLGGMDEDRDGFMFLDGDDEYLRSGIDGMIERYENQEEREIVIGEIGGDADGEWKV